MAAIQKINAHLWFDNNAEEAVKFYTSVFRNARIGRINRYGKEGYDIHKGKEGSIMTIEFWIEDQRFLVLNGGPLFKFNESISFVVNCDTQADIDYYWEKLSAGGDEKAQACGWLKDKFGVSWQVVPVELADMFSDHTSEKYQRVMKVMLKMKKLDIKTLQEA